MTVWIDRYVSSIPRLCRKLNFYKLNFYIFANFIVFIFKGGVKFALSRQMQEFETYRTTGVREIQKYYLNVDAVLSVMNFFFIFVTVTALGSGADHCGSRSETLLN
jgi:hypothetical protein